MKFTKIPTKTFEEIQLNAGILTTEFTPATATISPANIIGATSGGVSFEATPEYVDFGEDIDNVPANTKELKKLDTWTATMSGTFVTISSALIKTLAAAADIDENDETKIVPRVDLEQADFTDIWWVGDYSDKNGEASGGFIAIHMMNTLNTGGFKLTSGSKEKGQFEFEFTAHYSLAAGISKVPFEVYIKPGTAEA